jgi:pyruvate dehydrogenase E2 component (dihydrolipoamide acetyltransferase)
MPPLGATSDELRIVQWLVEVGAVVKQGDVLLEVETDKATLEVEAAVAGTLLGVLHGPGETVGVGEVLAFVGAPGEEMPVAEASEPPAGASPPPATPPAGADERVSAGRRQAVPIARRIAQEHGIDLAAVVGTGPGGRVEKADVLALIEADASRASDIELSRHRRAIAERLTQSVQTIPQFSVGADVDMRGATAFLAAERAAGLSALTYTHLLLRATAVALREHPEVNRLWVADGPRWRQLERTDVGLAVAGDDTLLVPTITEPDRVDLALLVEQTGEAERLARAGRLTGGPAAITLSNLGMFGVDRFAAIVDPEQTAILAVGAVSERVTAEAGGFRVGPWVELTLTVDHRVVDGVLAARFLGTIRSSLESL